MPKIQLNLSEQSINDAIKAVKEYQNSLPKKLETLRQRVADELAEDMRTGFNGSLYDDVLYEGMKVPDVQVTVEKDGNLTFVVAHGKEAVFVEFGAGVYYNPPAGSFPNPLRPNEIVAIGEYGKGYGKRKVWGYYDESGELKLTHGTPASMPMYYAVQRIVPRIPQIAKEVFGGGSS